MAVCVPLNIAYRSSINAHRIIYVPRNRTRLANGSTLPPCVAQSCLDSTHLAPNIQSMPAIGAWVILRHYATRSRSEYFAKTEIYQRTLPAAIRRQYHSELVTRVFERYNLPANETNHCGFVDPASTQTAAYHNGSGVPGKKAGAPSSARRKGKPSLAEIFSSIRAGR